MVPALISSQPRNRDQHVGHNITARSMQGWDPQWYQGGLVNSDWGSEMLSWMGLV